jgi:hypothetical protein
MLEFFLGEVKKINELDQNLIEIKKNMKEK